MPPFVARVPRVCINLRLRLHDVQAALQDSINSGQSWTIAKNATRDPTRQLLDRHRSLLALIVQRAHIHLVLEQARAHLVRLGHIRFLLFLHNFNKLLPTFYSLFFLLLL